MYDAVLISTHYNYDDEGTMIPPQNAEDYEDLSYIIPLGIIHIAQYLHDCGFKVRVLHIPHEMRSLRRFGMDEDEPRKNLENILRRYPAHVCRSAELRSTAMSAASRFTGISIAEAPYLFQISTRRYSLTVEFS